MRNNTYSAKEEAINIYTHFFGALMSFIGLFFLALKSMSADSFIKAASYIIFSLSLITLYTASTLYHSSKDERQRFKMKIFDHCAIFILIAGSYTPYALVVMDSPHGNLLASISWTIAIVGIILKCFFTGRFKVLSTGMYLMMGWVVLFFRQPLLASINEDCLRWLAIGGISYTLGAVIYSIKLIPFNHAIFHFFVLLGSASHFISIYFYT